MNISFNLFLIVVTFLASMIWICSRFVSFITILLKRDSHSAGPTRDDPDLDTSQWCDYLFQSSFIAMTLGLGYFVL